MKLNFGFCLQGLICFALVMIPNLFWFAFPSSNTANEPETISMIGIVQNVIRIAFLAATVMLVSKQELNYRSPYILFMVLMLALYYIAWIRYFAGGSDITLLVSKLWIIPIPLAIFPVLFFIGEALWLKNIPALIFVVIFGILHCYEAYMGYIKLS